MNRVCIFLVYVTMFFSLLGCSSGQKIELMKPEPDQAPEVQLPVASSVINFPIHLAVKDVESQANKSLNGLIYEDNTIADDGIEVKIWKNTPLVINEKEGKLRTVFPLKVWCKVRYGTSLLGVDMYDSREFKLEGVVTLSSAISMVNWQLHTVTALEDVAWKESPTVGVMGKDVKISFLIHPAISLFKGKIEKAIDDSVMKAINLKEQMGTLLQKMSEPVEISKVYETWLRINPEEAYVCNAVLKNNFIDVNVGIKCLIESFVGQKPNCVFDKSKIQLKAVAQLPNKVLANVAAVSTYSDASRIINNNFRGKEFSSGNRKITVQNVELWHKGGKVIVGLDMTGSLNGRIYLCGFPKYNAEKKEFYFDDLDYALETKSKLIKTANWFFQSAILAKIRANCHYSIAANIDEIKKNILFYMTNYSPMQGVYINGEITSLGFEKIQLSNQAIIGTMNMTGGVKIDVNGL